MYDTSQLIKGILEGCILTIINKKCSYGYDIITQLTSVGFKDIRESTIYPILIRLEKRKFITSYYEASPLGPIRKYYRITPDGVTHLDNFIEHWIEIEHLVNLILEGEFL